MSPICAATVAAICSSDWPTKRVGLRPFWLRSRSRLSVAVILTVGSALAGEAHVERGDHALEHRGHGAGRRARARIGRR